MHSGLPPNSRLSTPCLAAVFRIFIQVIVFALVVAACGQPGPKVYDETRTRACLVSEHLRVSRRPVSDFVASIALGGSFGVHFRLNRVTVSFGDTVKNAQDLDGIYRSVHAKNVGIDDVLRVQGSAVMLWHTHPSESDLARLLSCLKT